MMIGHRALRLRLGVGLFVLSWLPFAQLYIWAAGLHGSAADRARIAIWTIQVIVGFVGLLIAGSAAKAVTKTVGWRRLPGALWSMLRTGSIPTTTNAVAPTVTKP